MASLLCGIDGTDARGYRYVIRCRLWVADLAEAEQIIAATRARLATQKVPPRVKWDDYAHG